MENKIYYRSKIIKSIICASIAAIIAICLAINDGMQIQGAITLGVFAAGIPTGWSIISKIFGNWVIGSLPTLICYLLLKVILSVFIGGVVHPILLIYYIIKYIFCAKVENEISSADVENIYAN